MQDGGRKAQAQGRLSLVEAGRAQHLQPPFPTERTRHPSRFVVILTGNGVDAIHQAIRVLRSLVLALLLPLRPWNRDPDDIEPGGSYGRSKHGIGVPAVSAPFSTV